MTEKEFNIWCVRKRKEDDNDVTESMHYAKKVLKEEGFNPQWITENECMEVKKKEKNGVYLFDPFEGPTFDHIQEVGCRIFGPQCIISSLQFKLEIPKRSTPVYNLAMKDLTVCCTSMDKTIRDELHKKVEMMGGVVSKDFTEHVTHLVAGEVGSKKYQVAGSLGKQIMSPKWIEMVWEKSQDGHIHGTDSQFHDYRCLVFMGLVVTVSGLDSEERTQVKKLVESEGGKYTGEMNANECTHLIINKPKGSKYDHAKKWGVRIIKSDWLYDSIEKGFCLEESKYELKDSTSDMDETEVKTSTPEKHPAPDRGRSLADISCISNVSMMNINETAAPTDMTRKSICDMTRKCLSDMTRKSVDDPDETVNQIDLSKQTSDLFLDGCKIYLSGFRGQALEKLRKVINAGGGTRLNQLNENVTHVIMGDKIDKDVQILKTASFRPHVVSSVWIAECYKQGKTVDEEPFYCFELPALESASPKLKSKKTEKRKTAEKEKDMVPNKQKEDIDNDEMEILSQYMLQPDPENNEAPLNNIEDDDLTQDPDETYQPGITQKQLKDEESVNQIDMSKQSSDLFLDGCKIYLSGFKGQVLEKLCKVINAGGGTRLNQLNENVTHVIMGDKIDKDVQILKTASYRPHVVKAAWIAECYKQGNTVDEKQFSCLELPALESESTNMKSKNTEDRKMLENEASPEKQKLENTDAADVTTAADSRMFAKKVFMFFGFEEEPVSELTEYVTERGGLVIDEKDRRIPDYGIVPIDGYPVNRTVGEIATSAWLQVCLEQEKLLDINSNPLFTPIDIAMETECLKDCVLCISGYSGTEHDCLMHIAETLGAICQVYFARTQSKGLLPNTHLILKEAGGSKYEAAKKWGIPALSKNWLLKCAKTGKRESESKYEIDRKDVTMETDNSNQDNCDISIRTVEQNNLPNTSLNNKSAKNLNTSKADDEQREITKDKSASNHDSTLNACEQMEFSEFESSRNSQKVSRNEQEINKNKLVTRLSDSKKDNSMNIETSSVRNSGGRKPSLGETETKTTKLQESQKENCIQQKEDVSGKLQHSRLVEIRNELRSATPKNQSLHNASMSTPSPSKCLDVNQPFIPKFDISEAMQLLETPESQRKQRKLSKRKSSLSLEDYFTKHLEIGLKNIENYVHPNQEDGVMEGDEDKPLDGVVIAVSKKLSSQQAEFNDIVAALGGDYIWTYDKSCTHFIFKGRANDTSKEFKLAKGDKKCIVSPYWIQMCKEQNARVDESLFPHHYNPNLNLSNVVSSKKSETPLRNSRRAVRTPSRTPARTPARPVRGSSSKTQESVETVTGDELVMTDKVTESEVHKSETKSEEVEIASTHQNEEDKQEDQPQEVGQTMEMQEALSKHLENVMAMSKEKMDSQSSRAKKSRRKSKRLDSSGQFNESGETSGSGDRSSARVRRSEQDDLKESSGSRRSTRSSVKGPECHNSGSEASQSVQVIWDDPTGRLERERLAHKLERACSPTQEVMSNYDELLMENKPEFSDVEDEAVLNIPDPSEQNEEVKQNKSTEERVTTPEAPSIAFPMPKHSTNLEQPELINLDEASRDQTDQPLQKPSPVFIFSGLIPQEKDNYAALVEELGGKSSDAQYYDPTCTHLVIGSITRSEKFLASVAAGKWVLHKSYFEACRQENTFVQEDFYEWGGQGTMSLLSNQNSTVAKLAAAAHRWRVHIQEESLSQGSCSGAFNSWKVLLCAGETKEANFRRLLEAGGATVMNIKPPFPANLSCTHALLDLNKVKLTTEDLSNLISAGILCLKPEFISAHLTEDPDKLDHRQYCPAEVTELLSKLSDNSRERKRKTSSPHPAADTTSKRLRKK